MFDTMKRMSINLSAIKRKQIVIFLVFLLNLFLVLYYLTPSFLQINIDDGAKYIESGRKLLIWGLRDLSWGPLVAFIYAPIHLFLGNSPNWFMLEAWNGNVILFSLMWFSIYSLGKQLDKSLSIYVLIGLLFTWVGYHNILFNQSDALFLPLSVFALTQILKFRQERKIKHVWLASLFVGLGTLSRVETIILIIPLFIFSIWFNRGAHKLIRVILACLVPIIALILIFVVISFLTFGHPNLGMGGKAYFSYTHSLVQSFLPGSKNQQAYLRGEPIFGTLEENQGSVIRAILFNPSVLFERIIANIIRIPRWLGDYFGVFNRWLLILFGIVGLYSLFKSKDLELLLVLLIWPMHAVVALVFETLHFIPQLSYIFLILPGIGITYFFSNRATLKEKIAVIIISIIVIVSSIISQSYSLLAVGIIVIIVTTISILLQDQTNHSTAINYLPAVVLLTSMLFFQDGFVFPVLRLGQSEDEIAVHNLQSSFPNQSQILAMKPRSIVAAKMEHTRYPRHIDEVDEFISFLSNNQVAGVFYDDKLHFPSDLMGIALAEYPELFTLVHQSESRSIRIYRFNDVIIDE